ncbi:MAG: protoporphyrinogen oxidase [Bryobacteraceae bacterium]
MPRVVIVGGGISGLSAAYDLTRTGIDCAIFEKRPRVGGVIETRTIDNCVLESGPDSFLSAKPEALALIKELGLEGELIGSNDSQRATYIVKQGRLIRMPEGIMMIAPTKIMPVLKTPLLGIGTKIRMGLELFRRPGVSRDRSVANFVEDHFGREVLDYLAEPLLSGVYGGDPREMSVAAVLPRFLEMEARYGSLARGAMRSRPGGPRGPIFRTLKRGLGQLIEAISKNLKIENRCVEAIEKREGGGFRLRAAGEWIDAEQVILACPAPAAAMLVREIVGELSAKLGEIVYSSSALVSLVYDTSRFDGRRAGFGFLVPRRERKRMAACTFASTKFPFRAPEHRIVLRCFFGGMADPSVLNESDESLAAIALAEVREYLGLTAAPLFSSIARWPCSMAQYSLGHLDRIEQIKVRAAAIPGLHLAGNAYEGIGIPDCIRTGRNAAKSIIS